MTNNDGGRQVLPFYIVCDESFSMSDRIDDVNAALRDLHRSIASDPVVSDKAQIGVITFSDQGEILVELTNPEDLTTMPGCAAKGGTSYSAAFSTLRSAIGTDVARLKSKGFQVLRPVAFFITDGAPTDGDAWRAVHADLVKVDDDNNPYRPHILSFGVDAADQNVILDIATEVNRFGRKFAFLADEGTAPGPALKEIIGKLAATIVGSTKSKTPTLVPPTDIPGVTDIGVVDLDVL